MRHTCHAKGCDVDVPPRMLMCKPHWFMLPKDLRDAIWREYVPGQEVRKDPTPEYLKVMKTAIDWVWNREQEIAEKKIPKQGDLFK